MQNSFLFSSFILLLVIVDPLTLPLFFMQLTRHFSNAARKRVAFLSSLFGGSLLILFALTGGFLLNALKISSPALQISGGILLLMISINMVMSNSASQLESAVSEAQVAQVAVFPLAVPFIAGPGALTAIVIQTNEIQGDIFLTIGLIAIIVVVMLITYLCLHFSSFFIRVLGEVGVDLIARVFGIFLAALSVQFILGGVIEVYRQLS